MNRFLLASIAVLCLVGCQSTPQQVETHVSPAGHEFAFFPMPKAKSVSIRIHWADSWARSPSHNTAVPYLGARMMLEGGAGDRTAAELGEAFEDIGGRGHIQPDIGGVLGSMDVRADRVGRVLPLVRDVIDRPQFLEKWQQRVATDLQNQHGEWLEGPQGKLVSAIQQLTFDDETLKRSLMVRDVSTFSNIERQTLLDWQASVFDVAPTAIAVAGRIKVGQAAKTLDDLMGERVAAAPLEPWTDSALNFEPVSLVLQDSTMSSSVMLFAGGLPPEQDASEFFKRVIAIRAFAQGESSPLMRRVREELGATYGFYWYYGGTGTPARQFSFSAEIDPDQLIAVRDIVQNAWDGYRRAGPSQATVENAIETELISLREMRRENPGNAAASLMNHLKAGRDPIWFDEHIDALEKMDAASIREHIQSDFPHADGLMEILLTPEKGAWPGACEVESLEQIETCRVDS